MLTIYALQVYRLKRSKHIRVLKITQRRCKGNKHTGGETITSEDHKIEALCRPVKINEIFGSYAIQPGGQALGLRMRTGSGSKTEPDVVAHLRSAFVQIVGDLEV